MSTRILTASLAAAVLAVATPPRAAAQPPQADGVARNVTVSVVQANWSLGAPNITIPGSPRSPNGMFFVVGLQNRNREPVHVFRMQVTWRVGARDETTTVRIRGPVIPPGLTRYTAFRVEQPAGARWGPDSPFRVTVAEAEAEELTAEQDRDLRADIANERRIDVIEVQGASGGFLGLAATLDNRNRHELLDVKLLVTGFNHQGHIGEVFVFHIDRLPVGESTFRFPDDHRAGFALEDYVAAREMLDVVRFQARVLSVGIPAVRPVRR